MTGLNYFNNNFKANFTTLFFIGLFISINGCSKSGFDGNDLELQSLEESSPNSRSLVNSGNVGYLAGYIDRSNSTSSGGAIVSGWACLKGTAASISVRLYLGGESGKGGKLIANNKSDLSSEQAVGQACGTTFNKYRFHFNITAETVLANPGSLIYVYGVYGLAVGAIGNSGNYKLPGTALSNNSTPQETQSIMRRINPNDWFNNTYESRVNFNVTPQVINSLNDHVTITWDAPTISTGRRELDPNSDIICSVQSVETNANASDRQTHGKYYQTGSTGRTGRMFDFPTQTTTYTLKCDLKSRGTRTQRITVRVMPTATISSFTKPNMTTPDGTILADITSNRNCGVAVLEVQSVRPTTNLCKNAFWMAGGNGYDPDSCRNASNQSTGVYVSSQPVLSRDGKKWTWECTQPSKQTCVNNVWVYSDMRTTCEVPTI